MRDIRTKEIIRKVPAKHIHHAIEVGNLTSLKLLLGNYPHLINERNSNYDTPMLATLKASLNKSVELSIIKFLLNYNVNVNLQSVLIVACISNKTRIARLILQEMTADIDFSVRDNNGCTVLMHFAVYNDIGLIKEILSRSKKEGIQVENHAKKRALDLAKERKNKEIIDMLFGGGYLPIQSNLKPQEWVMNLQNSLYTNS